MKNNFLFYLCECNFPSTSAYSIHVVKMCDELAKKYNVILVTPNSSLSFNSLKKNYYIKNKFEILSIFKEKKQLHFLNRIIFSLRFYNILKDKFYKKRFKIFSRSVLASLFLSIQRFKNILEIHHRLNGLTKYTFLLSKFFKFYKNISFILLNRSLKKILKVNDALILDDAVDFDQFNKKNMFKKYKFTCLYIGSFHKGKGIEQIYDLAKLCPKIQFHIYGDKKFLPKNLDHAQVKNIKLFNYVNYSKIPSLLNKYEVALMPLQKKNFGRGNIDISDSTSPMKMFDYLASGKILLASKLSVYNHILMSGYNCFLIDPKNLTRWKDQIYKVFNNLSKSKKLKVNAKKTAMKYTWQLRVKKIEKKYLNKL